MDWDFNGREEDAEDYIEHAHFEDIQLPERDAPDPQFNEEEKLRVETAIDPEATPDYEEEE